MPTIAHKQRPNIPNTTVGGTSGFAMMVGAVSVLKAAGWKYAGSSDGTTVNKTTDPAQDRWATTPGTIGSLTASGSGAVIAAPARGRATITGLTGVVASWKGQFLKITGSAVSANNNCHQIEEILSATSVKIDARNFAVAADGVGRAWEIRDPLTEAISTVRTWWCGVGPHTLKVPITAYPSTRLLPGERLVQAASGFEGELRDIVWNVGSSTGYLTLYGQVRGIGSDVYGLSNGQQFTGQTTNGTVTQVGTAQEFRMEIVIHSAGGDTSGNIYYGCFDINADARFSTRVASVGCTATVPPGGGGTGNAFPTYAWYAWNTNWARAGAGANTDQGFAVCADAIEEQGYSADGSYMAGTFHRVSGGTYQCQGLQLTEGGDYGDCAPWISWTPYASNLAYDIGVTNTTSVSEFSGLERQNTWVFEAVFDNTANSVGHTFLRGWSRRGFGGTYDRFQVYECAVPEVVNSLSGTSNGLFGCVQMSQSLSGGNSNNNANLMRSNNHDELVTTLVPVSAGSYRTGTAAQAPNPLLKQHKGRFRWIKMADGGHTNSLHHDGLFLQLAGRSVNFCVGPFNGVAPTITQIVAGRLYPLSDGFNSGINVNFFAPVASRRMPNGTLIDTATGIPADPGGANWEAAMPPEARVQTLFLFKSNFSTNGFWYTNFSSTAGQSRGGRSWVSPPLAAQTISGTVKGQALVALTLAATSVYVQSRLYVLTPQGTVRGVLRELLPAADVSGGLAIPLSTQTNRKLFRNGALTTLAVSAGDYLVFELGVNNTSGVAPQVRYQMGDGNAADLPENETSTTLASSWIEFSTPLVFLYSAGSQN